MITEITSQEQFQELIQNPRVLVEFYSKTCGPCKMLAFVLKDVDKAINDITILTVDFDAFGELKEQFKVAGFPTILFMKEGREVSRMQGLKQKTAIIDAVNAL